jgi:hypothetical protein
LYPFDGNALVIDRRREVAYIISINHDLEFGILHPYPPVQGFHTVNFIILGMDRSK